MTNENIKKLDLLFVLESAKKIGIKSLRENSIQRIIYFCYIFDYLNKEKVFKYSYDFHIDTEGTYSIEIHKLLIDLSSNYSILKIENKSHIETFEIDIVTSQKIKKYYQTTHSEYYDKYKWIDTVIKILGLYGEEKLFDFIYRDPIINESLSTNQTKTIDRDTNTLTKDYLNSFKNEFEQYLKDEEIEITIDNNKYLEAYFEYIFSQIMRGE
ncbi:hypothetical protein [Aliarcobacter cryaerophilus]|uniref:hypothetical protein n=1 Tax=Aliarcobacter cryaerophilus TaxID=28198 RepID=UPI0021B28208|nr:hypothetical protein [Aliarcobacter cryaerophilus]MCT7508507.1 hypothetical protein [Aliarcobacter cryaerophilus]